ncbi:DUF2254 domain-containing protein [Niabella ginsengisoli]|uniref:DUF2254 domain-containing protein n=1 Tax=Niabella ginsengisoli TaxID=522298 RepID=UPI0021D422B9|nr:DUF2254 domain-containing protein [Niabella ginsengisoli]
MLSKPLKAKLLYLWDKLQSSFWFVPVCIITAGIVGSILVVYADSKISYTPKGLISYVFPGSADSARSVLSTIAGAMIGVAGTIFSITLVVLTLASSQFGSRLLRNFMYDRLNQVVLGSYISTFIYCLLVLNAVEDNNHQIFYQ